MVCKSDSHFVLCLLHVQCGDCRSELLVKPSSPESVKWGPRYRYPVYLPCKYCGNKYTVADLMDAVDAVRSTA